MEETPLRGGGLSGDKRVFKKPLENGKRLRYDSGVASTPGSDKPADRQRTRQCNNIPSINDRTKYELIGSLKKRGEFTQIKMLKLNFKK